MTKNFTTKAAKVLTIATLSAGTLIGAIALDTSTVSASSVSQISGDESKGKIQAVTNLFPTFESAQAFVNGQMSQMLFGESYRAVVIPENSLYIVEVTIDYDALTSKDQAIALANQVVAAADSAISGTAPVTPAEPETPVVPDESTTPAEPETPVTPEEPTTPTEPVTPVEPTTPTEPETPVTPVEPTAPTEPETPVTPEEPTTPTEPVVPEEPTTPTEPETPITPVEPTTPIEVSKNQKSSTTKEEIKKVIPDNSTEAIKKDVKTLPNTGDAGSVLSIIGSGLLSLGGYVALKRKN
ncbi:TPA: LPXTG cell wall anchor domain-containing protein [Streptococcus suis]|nr:LPXTG cell wall anchor domain-containing protein [Streptococcus suis]NQO04120.1 LPXTG cell wall anchor domain-containing protein [Streptococcus suis]NQO30254.1 LPXTG cell wall anchor domain-containing protein [Streptococcus suis]NQO69061.1 LPXTG cell wall anchor domain-containing protein [Streptococcus suis]NQO77049.1 LPXTG cell wall anchor domain-containing protein [Streptococcus suis]